MDRPITHSLVKALRTIPGFELFDDDALLRIVGASVNLVWPAGRTIFEKGSPGEVLYIILSGEVRIYDKIDGEEIEIARTKAGDFFGEMSLMLDTVHTKYAEAVTDTELLILMKDPFRSLLDKNPELHALVRRRLEERRARPVPKPG
jgi:CRP/FNR family transcriptional regulator, cyclic AMP receptor protein